MRAFSLSLFSALVITAGFISSQLANAKIDATEMLLPVTPTLSPDGKLLVFSWNHDLWVKPTDADDKSDAVRLTFHPSRETNPLFSPDGKLIYYNSNRKGSTQIWVMNADGSGQPKQITIHSSSNYIEDITADGKHVLYQSMRIGPGKYPHRIFSQDVAGKEPEKMPFKATAKSARLSPDGSKILFTREGVNLYRKGYSGSKAAQIWIYDKASKLFTQPVKDEYGCLSPLWFKDGSGFYYISGKSGNFNLWKHDLTSSNSTQLTTYKEDSVMFPAISADGSKLVFRKLFHYYIYDTLTGKTRQMKLHHNLDLAADSESDYLIKSCSDADFSPSGLEIVFAANGELYAMDTVLREPVRLTNSPAYEKNTYFAEDAKAIYYISDDGVKTSINKLTKKDSSEYWWTATDVVSSSVINSSETIFSFIISPNGKQIAYATENGKLYCYDKKTKVSKLIDSSWKTPTFNWSPDSKWLTYSLQDNDFNSDIYLAPIDGSTKPINITKHPDNEFSPSFSPDGKKICFIGKRRGSSYDLYYVDLTPAGAEQSARDKKLELAKKAMKSDPAYKNASSMLKNVLKKITPKSKEELKSKQKVKVPPVAKSNKKADSASSPDVPSKKSQKEKPTKNAKKSKNNYDLEDVQKRIIRITLKGMTPSKVIWNKDSKGILFQSKKYGKVTYLVDIKSKKTSKFIDAGGFPIRFNKKGVLYWINNGVPGVVKGGKATNYTFTLQAQHNREAYNRHVFRLIWRNMQNGFYDENMNGKNWGAILKKYENTAAKSSKTEDFDRVVMLLLGELNASHCGYTTAQSDTWEPSSAWTKSMRHIGVVHEAKADGWHITNVLPNGPADQVISKLETGEIITMINGKAVNDKTVQHTVLWGQMKDELALKVKDKDGNERSVTLAPIDTEAARRLTSVARIDHNKEMVEKQSNGKLGYIHISRMMWDEFEKFEQHLYENGAGKDGLIIDVRDNGGGFTTDHLLTALKQPRHAYTIPRNGGIGYPQDRFVYATWSKPITVLCNQNSFSNAEIFTHAIRTLNRGKVVGVSTAGGVISTGKISILTAGSLRMPFRGWFLIDSGEDMEVNGAKPHYEVWTAPGELAGGIDKQITKAVEILTKDTEDYKNKERRVQPKYRSR